MYLVDVILKNCPITTAMLNLLVYCTIQYSTIVIIVDYSKSSNDTTKHYELQQCST